MKEILNKSFVEEKNSKFYGYLYELQNIKEVDEIVNNLKADHKKASHFTYAYKYLTNAKRNDDGEPKGTAGPPIYNIIEKKNLDKILIVVVRYFGGKKLGANTLLRCYSKAASKLF